MRKARSPKPTQHALQERYERTRLLRESGCTAEA
jgi:hypothetical protein